MTYHIILNVPPSHPECSTKSRCAIRPFCTPRCPKPRHGVRFAHFAHRDARNHVTVCNSALLNTARPLTPTSSCTSHHDILNAPPRHPERSTKSRCAIRPFCTPRCPKPRHGVRFAHFAHRKAFNPHIILHVPPRHPELDSGSVLRKPRFRIESG
jgi:hypothetical protein